MQRYRVGAVLVGMLAGLLLIRLVALLFVARPDNPLSALILTITTPLTAPFAVLDRLAGQPRFGARLELATLAALALLVIAAGSVQWALARQRPDQAEEESYAESQRVDREGRRPSGNRRAPGKRV